ncbi:hypothetical protein GCM10011494_20900 [Novosphingobium endophyticum]|uniref:Uncharacterized protein n=1 Tax=Novosphingobium endophyticum TaxID=1955250 RepID=A0A916TSF9_9SPHN|nr:hypothetical protein [Novosphingobium endophyticum]GGC02177.1 hypothetical protein GCM10011494_20900 [Novosphingobium endophyticum]
MTVTMGRRAIWLAVAIPIIALLVWAWIDAGYVPVHEIVEPVAVPELAQ